MNSDASFYPANGEVAFKISRKGFTPRMGKSVYGLEDATQYILNLLYNGKSSPVSFSTPKKSKRNDLIRQRYAVGESAVDLAKEFGISEQRIYQILRGKRK